MYKALYVHENFLTGEITEVEETFEKWSDAQTFLDQANFGMYDHSKEWENSNFNIVEIN